MYTRRVGRDSDLYRRAGRWCRIIGLRASKVWYGRGTVVTGHRLSKSHGRDAARLRQELGRPPYLGGVAAWWRRGGRH
ncbi:hypothetical protein J6590_052755 [Homalodisca vitripennis]|nr:hypothetical protein J6590_052755 [Homalodisca vitripennis]